MERLPLLTRSLWAKSSPVKSLWHHMLDTGLCAAQLVEEDRFAGALRRAAEFFSLSTQETKALIAYLCALHDYGKASPAFQKKDASLAAPFVQEGMLSMLDKAQGFRHERYGADCYEALGEEGCIPSLVARVFASAIRLHHQGKFGHASAPKREKERWQAMSDELHRAIIEVFHPPLKQMNTCGHCDAAVMALLPMIVLADWIASSEPFAHLDETLDDAAYISASAEAARDAIHRYGLSSPQTFPQIDEYRQMWPAFSESALRPVQAAILRLADPAAGLTIVEAPMGEGKTEAGAFQAARGCSLWGKQGIYFALPTAATSNQMFTRINDMLSALGLDGARLMHGMAWLAGEDEGQARANMEDKQDACDWLRPLRRAMLAESAVGTVDQAMMAAMPIRYGCLRLLGLMGKALVIDEIHAYDAYMSEIIERLLEWCQALRIPVVLLSATLTAQKRKRLVEAYGGTLETVGDAYPLITQVRDGKALEIPVDGCIKRGAYRFELLRAWKDDRALAERAVARVARGGCLCVLMNTVAQAQSAWKAIRALATPDTAVMLFHARFKASQRDRLEKECVRCFGKDGAHRPQKAILVCTQVVEQSLDLDFDGMITQIAPIDLLLQRAGRVHRHERPRPEGMEEALVEVVVPENEDYAETGLIYAPWLLAQTQQLLPKTVRIPQDVRCVLETVYRQPDDIPQAWAEMMFSEQRMQAQAGGNMLPRPDPRRFFGWDAPGERFSMEEPEEGTAARTRLGDCSARVALLPEETIEKLLAAPLDHALARLAFENSFTIRESLPAGEEQELAREGEGLCRGLWLVPEERLPVRLGRTKLDYDGALGALTERVRCD